MTVKLKSETNVNLDAADLRAILTDYICSGSYGAFADLHVTQVTQTENGDFDLVLVPNAPEQSS